jgi:hypothetical protein
MATHDLLCPKCETLYPEITIHYTEIKDGSVNKPCEVCGEPRLNLYYGLWKGEEVNLYNDGLGDTRHDKYGRIRSFGAQDDPLVKAELGMFKRPQDKGLQTFSDDQVLHFRERLAVEGDSQKMRQKILETRQQNISRGQRQ